MNLSTSGERGCTAGASTSSRRARVTAVGVDAMRVGAAGVDDGAGVLESGPGGDPMSRNRRRSYERSVG